MQATEPNAWIHRLNARAHKQRYEKSFAPSTKELNELWKKNFISSNYELFTPRALYLIWMDCERLTQATKPNAWIHKLDARCLIVAKRTIFRIYDYLSNFYAELIPYFISQILKQYHVKVLFSGFQLNGHIKSDFVNNLKIYNHVNNWLSEGLTSVLIPAYPFNLGV